MKYFCKIEIITFSGIPYLNEYKEFDLDKINNFDFELELKGMYVSLIKYIHIGSKIGFEIGKI